MTERVTPLSWQVKRHSLNEETAKWGIYTVSVRTFWFLYLYSLTLSPHQSLPLFLLCVFEDTNIGRGC